MKEQESEDSISAAIVLIYAGILVSLICIFEWVRKCRMDSKKEHVPDAFQKMANCIGLSDMSINQLQLMLSEDYITKLIEDKTKV
jgi:hypothetical protein